MKTAMIFYEHLQSYSGTHFFLTHFPKHNDAAVCYPTTLNIHFSLVQHKLFFPPATYRDRCCLYPAAGTAENCSARLVKTGTLYIFKIPTFTEILHEIISFRLCITHHRKQHLLTGCLEAITERWCSKFPLCLSLPNCPLLKHFYLQ
jgi:hypothetical protein